MAMNGTQTPVARGVELLAANALKHPQLEKISCSFVPEGAIDPMLLLGLEVEVEHPCPYGSDVPEWPTRYSGRVVSVDVGSPALGQSSSICIKQPGIDPDFVSCSQITILSVSA